MILFYFYKISRRILTFFADRINKIYSSFILKGNNVKYSSFKTTGFPYIMVANGGYFSIGDNFMMNNGIRGNPIGCYDSCTFVVDRKGTLIIGDSVGISQSTIVCHHRIIIGNNVKIGGGVKIYDTDFHSLNPIDRMGSQDFFHKVDAEIEIKDNAFIGAYSIVLKGVVIGKNSIIGAGSLVTKSVPDNQIWGGNPAKFIRNI